MSNVYVHFSQISFPARYSVVKFQVKPHSLRFREVITFYSREQRAMWLLAAGFLTAGMSRKSPSYPVHVCLPRGFCSFRLRFTQKNLAEAPSEQLLSFHIL